MNKNQVFENSKHRSISGYGAPSIFGFNFVKKKCGSYIDF